MKEEEEENKRSIIFCTIIPDNWIDFAVFQLESLESYSEVILVYLIRFELFPLQKLIESFLNFYIRVNEN